MVSLYGDEVLAAIVHERSAQRMNRLFCIKTVSLLGKLNSRDRRGEFFSTL